MAATRMSTTRAVLILVQDMVLASLHRLGRQHMIQLVATGVFISPLPYGVEHVPLNLYAFIAQSWVVERPKNIVDNFVDRNAGIFPSIKDASKNFSIL
jgi:hypothetical protein